MKRVNIDTNILARYLMEDDERLFKKTVKLFEEAEEGKYEIYIDEVVLAETIWLLYKHYGVERRKLAELLGELVILDWIFNPRKDIILSSLSMFGASNMSFVDCWIAELSRKEKVELRTFDEKLRKKTS